MTKLRAGAQGGTQEKSKGVTLACSITREYQYIGDMEYITCPAQLRVGSP